MQDIQSSNQSKQNIIPEITMTDRIPIKEKDSYYQRTLEPFVDNGLLFPCNEQKTKALKQQILDDHEKEVLNQHMNIESLKKERDKLESWHIQNIGKIRNLELKLQKYQEKFGELKE